MATRNLYKISIINYSGNDNSFVIHDVMKISFSSKLCIATGMKPLDTISYELEGDLLTLKHGAPRNDSISKQEQMVRVRAISKTSCAIHIGSKKIPALFEFNLPTKATTLEWEVVDDKLVINMSAFRMPIEKPKKAPETTAAGFGALKAEPVVVKRGGFEVLRGPK